MDCIDEEYPDILPEVVDPSRLPILDEEGVVTDADQGFDVRNFLEKYCDGAPIIETLTNLRDRYG